MPNWCSNSITTNNPTIIAAAKEAEADESGFFTKLFPMPEALNGIVQGGCTDIHGNRVRLWRETPEGNVGLNPAEEAELIANYGTASWYNWSVENWSTKWDTDVRAVADNSDGTVTIIFDTAWAPPENWLRTVMEQHPEGRTVLAYSEGGMGYFGLTIYQDGDLVEEWTIDDAFWSDELDDEECSLPTTICQNHLDLYSLHTGG